MPIPELNLSLGLTENNGSVFYAGSGEGKVITRSDSSLKKHTISITISEKQVGKVYLNTNNSIDEKPQQIEIPTYQLTVIDDKTNEKEIYEVTRDTYFFKENTVKKGFWNFLGFKFLRDKNYLFENLSYEPLNETIETFDISKYRKLSHNELIYNFKNGEQSIQIYAGDINNFNFQQGTSYFVIVDEKNGRRFIGDILYREKVLKLTPKVELQIIKRKEVSRSLETNKKGQTEKVIYI